MDMERMQFCKCWKEEEEEEENNNNNPYSNNGINVQGRIQ